MSQFFLFVLLLSGLVLLSTVKFVIAVIHYRRLDRPNAYLRFVDRFGPEYFRPKVK